MNTPDKFNFQRFGLAARQYFSYNKKQLLGGVLATLGFLTLLAFIVGNAQEHDYDMSVNDGFEWSDPTTIYSETVEVETWVFTFCFLIFSVIAGSLTFSGFKSKKKRISSLMLPMAKSEMFILRVLIYTVLANLMFVVCCIAADALRSTFIFGPSIWTVHNNFFTHNFVKEALLLITSFALLGQAFYTLGSVLWPRNSFIISFGVTFVLLLLFILFNPVITYILVNVIEFLYDDLYDEQTPLKISFTFFAMAIGVYWLAWLRFKRYQIILKL